MVKTAENFAAGFFGVPEYLDEVNIEIIIEASGSNNTGAPYDVCKNANVATKGSVGSAAATKFATNTFNSTLDRLNGQLKGIELTPTDIIAMLQLCSYETDALGYSAFCKVFTEEDFKNYEYYFDVRRPSEAPVLSCRSCSITTMVSDLPWLLLKARDTSRSLSRGSPKLASALTILPPTRHWTTLPNTSP